MRLIDADKLKKNLEPHKDSMGQTPIQTWEQIWKSECEYIDSEPTIEAEPIRHGHWIFNEVLYAKYGDNFANCSECGYEIDVHYHHGYPKYCEECGAKMGVTE